jgi:hypothetical protein
VQSRDSPRHVERVTWGLHRVACGTYLIAKAERKHIQSSSRSISNARSVPEAEVAIHLADGEPPLSKLAKVGYVHVDARVLAKVASPCPCRLDLDTRGRESGRLPPWNTCVEYGDDIARRNKLSCQHRTQHTSHRHTKSQAQQATRSTMRQTVLTEQAALVEESQQTQTATTHPFWMLSPCSRHGPGQSSLWVCATTRKYMWRAFIL